MGGALLGLDASWLSGAGEAGKKAFHSCGLPWDTDYSRSGSLHSVRLHMLHHINTGASLCLLPCDSNQSKGAMHSDGVVEVLSGLGETATQIIPVSAVGISGWHRTANVIILLLIY